MEQFSTNSVEKLSLEVPYRTALDKATKLLKNPHSIWEGFDVLEQHRLFFFIFEQKLPYNQLTGYRTEGITTISAFFEEFSSENSADVDLGGIGPPPRQCE